MDSSRAWSSFDLAGDAARSGAVCPSALWNGTESFAMHACHELGDPLLKARILLRELQSPRLPELNGYQRVR
jgi:hypothetical protein